ncbi:unnamed protein product, partial [Prorocentrum cordatum]
MLKEAEELRQQLSPVAIATIQAENDAYRAELAQALRRLRQQERCSRRGPPRLPRRPRPARTSSGRCPPPAARLPGRAALQPTRAAEGTRAAPRLPSVAPGLLRGRHRTTRMAPEAAARAASDVQTAAAEGNRQLAAAVAQVRAREARSEGTLQEAKEVVAAKCRDRHVARRERMRREVNRCAALEQQLTVTRAQVEATGQALQAQQ